MKQLTSELFAEYMKQAGIKTRLRREVRFRPAQFEWAKTELAFALDKSGNNGILIAQPYNELFLVPFEISRGLTDRAGRTKPITCDFCYTWQSGSGAASITFTHLLKHTITYLCCADLRCSDHVRGSTAASATSRSQLHENMTNEQRVMRLRHRLKQIIDHADSLGTALALPADATSA